MLRRASRMESKRERRYFPFLEDNGAYAWTPYRGHATRRASNLRRQNPRKRFSNRFPMRGPLRVIVGGRAQKEREIFAAGSPVRLGIDAA